MTALCPMCGWMIDPNQRVYRDGWMIDPSGVVAFKGPALGVRETYAKILHALASTEAWFSADGLLNLISERENTGIIRVQICKLRRWLRENGLPDPIETRGGHSGGYRWRAPVSVFAHSPEVSHA